MDRQIFQVSIAEKTPVSSGILSRLDRRVYVQLFISERTRDNRSGPGLGDYCQQSDLYCRVFCLFIQTNYFPVEATRIAEDELGRVLFANIVMLGALAAVTRFVSLQALENSLEGNVPPKTIEQNRAALKKGYQFFLTKGSLG